MKCFGLANRVTPTIGDRSVRIRIEAHVVTSQPIEVVRTSLENRLTEIGSTSHTIDITNINNRESRTLIWAIDPHTPVSNTNSTLIEVPPDISIITIDNEIHHLEEEDDLEPRRIEEDPSAILSQ